MKVIEIPNDGRNPLVKSEYIMVLVEDDDPAGDCGFE